MFTKFAVYNYPYASTASGSNLPANPVKYACDFMALNSRDPLTALRDLAAFVYNGSSPINNCFDINTEFVECKHDHKISIV